MRNTTSPPTEASLKALRARITKPLVLVGMMGVGKSTVGRKLAQMLEFDFFDADDEIVEAANMPITDIFDTYGEAHFRDGERRVIARLLEKPTCIIATGGGAFVEDETRAVIAQHGIAIWLDSDVETLVERVSRNNKRPLLRGGNIEHIVRTMKADREPFYKQAPIRAISDGGPHSQTVLRIIKGLDKWL